MGEENRKEGEKRQSKKKTKDDGSRCINAKFKIKPEKEYEATFKPFHTVSFGVYILGADVTYTHPYL